MSKIKFRQGVLTSVFSDDMETDNATWVSLGATASNTRSSTEAHGGTYSRRIITGPTLSGAQSSGLKYTTKTGYTYAVTVWIWTDTEATFVVSKRRGDDVGYIDFASTGVIPASTWTKIEQTYVEVGGGAEAFIQVYTSEPIIIFYLDDVDISEEPFEFDFSVARVFPVNDPVELGIVTDYSEGGQLYAYDKGIAVQTHNLPFKRLSEADNTSLLNWFKNISVGPLNTFVFIDEVDVEHTVNWMDTQYPIKRDENDRYNGSLRLREEL